MKDISLYSENLSDGSALTILKKYGVVIIPSYVSTEKIISLNLEFEEFLKKENDGVVNVPYSLGESSRIFKSKFDQTKFPLTSELFFSRDFGLIAKRYLACQVDLNEEIFAVRDVVGSQHHANDLHYDVIPTFKFFIYLTDTSEKNGAFNCVPGSHIKTSEYRKRYQNKIAFENREITRDLDLDLFDGPIPIEGKAGTLIIFDTDVWHKAGTVSHGERKVLRGHTRPVKSTGKSTLSRIKSLFTNG